MHTDFLFAVLHLDYVYYRFILLRLFLLLLLLLGALLRLVFSVVLHLLGFGR